MPTSAITGACSILRRRSVPARSLQPGRLPHRSVFSSSTASQGMGCSARVLRGCSHRRRRSAVANLIIISWRDIPAQVIVKRGRETAKVQLSARFQEAVDRAAMRAGKGSSDAYLADWKRSDPTPCGEDLQAEAAAAAAKIEAKYSDADLERLIRAKGLEVPADSAPPGGGS